MIKNKENIGIHIPTILLPNPNIDLLKWCVIACDQYTSQPEYWNNVEEFVKDAPSTLHLVFPEVYLDDGNDSERIKQIVKKTKEYLDNKILIQQKPGFIFVDRQTSNTPSRKGLIIGMDLEEYSYETSSQTLIRATEETVVERIPPRVKIRENALIETPHIMVLIDDEEKTVIEPLIGKVNEMDKLYDTELMMDGGHIKGYAVNDNEMIENIIEAISKLAQAETFQDKYKVNKDVKTLLYAMGDGNHSLATAKARWEAIKPTLNDDEIKNHPARFALVELVNLYDEGLVFEPIHRVVFNVNPTDILEEMVSYYKLKQCEASYLLFNSKSDLSTYLEYACNEKNKTQRTHIISFVFKDNYGVISVKNAKHNLEVGTLHNFLDQYLDTHKAMKIDYVHGEDVVNDLANESNNIGFLLPPMDKHDLFKTVILDGVLPAKTFSMGEAEEKRFYLECRKIK